MQLGTRPNPWYCVPVVRGSPACGRGICEYHSMSGYLLQGHSCPKERGIWPRLEGLAAGRCNLNPVSAAFPSPPRDSAIEPVLKRSHMEQTERNCHRSCSHMPQEQSGSDCWTQLHGHRPLHRGDVRVPQSGSTIEGGEGGGATRFISGSKRCLPWPCKLLMHFRKEWHRRGALKTSATPPPRNHSSNLEGSGRGGGFHTSPTFSAARESIAVISGSGSDNATTPEGGNAAESSSPEREGSPSDAATDIWSSGEAPKETGGVPHSAEAPVRTNGTPPAAECLRGEKLHLWKPSP